MNWVETFIEDYFALTLEERVDKYFRKIPKDVSIQMILDYLEKNHQKSRFVNDIFYGDRRDRESTFLLKRVDGKYEVFISERGGKCGVNIHNSLKAGLKEKIDIIFNNLGHAAPDSIINKKVTQNEGEG